MVSEQDKVEPGEATERASDFRSDDHLHTGSHNSLRVCLVTTEFHGLFKNGGIGTANTGLALALASAGYRVTVAFSDSDQHGPRLEEGNFADLAKHYARLGITLDSVPAYPAVAKGFGDPRSASYCVYIYLRDRSFDVVFFNDCGGQGFFSLLAKRTGVLAKPPRMYVVAHGPHEWVLDLNSLRYWDRMPIVTSYLERRCAAMADSLISPSQYLIDWMVAHDWDMPRHVHVVQNIIPLPDVAMTSWSQSSQRLITEIVFFGRLEVRKGIELFCDAVDLLNHELDLSHIRITFMGKFSHIAGLHSGIYVMERARSWRSSLRIITRYGQEEALSYLARPAVMAVMPSSAENSPCVVAECVHLGIAFIATNTGGTVELVAPGDREACLVDPYPEALSRKLRQALEGGQRRAALAISQQDLLDQWLQLIARGKIGAAEENEDSGVKPYLKQTPIDSSLRPLVSVCLTTACLTPSARSFLQTLLRQDYSRLEFVLVDDGRDEKRSAEVLAEIRKSRPGCESRSVTVVARDQKAQRNRAAGEARGEYLLFAHEDQVELLPQCIDNFVTAAMLVNTSLVTGVPFLSDSQPAMAAEPRFAYLPVGACIELGGIENCFGGGAFLVARTAFEEIGGFETNAEPEIEDWLFMASAALKGFDIEVVPEPLFSFKNPPAPAADRSRAVDGYRRILSVYSSQKAGVFRHIIESIVHVEHSRDVARSAISSKIQGEALNIATRISTGFEANSDEALRGFIQFCIERHRVQDALDFALYNRRALLSDAIGAANMLAESIALDEVRGHTLDALHNVALSDDVRERIRAVSAFPVRELSQPPGCVASHALDNGLTVLKAAAVCPRGTKFVRAHARLELSQPASVSLAIAVSVPAARLRLTENGLESSDRFWWSKWVPATQIADSGMEKTSDSLTLEVTLLKPEGELLDLHLLCRTDDDGTQPEGKITWSDVISTVAIDGVISASEIVEDATPVPSELIAQGVLLTPATEFSFPVFVPGNPTLVHPLPRRTVLVRIGDSVPPGSAGVRSVVSLQLADSHPVQFAVWVRSSAKPAASETEFGATDAFSGWFTVRDKFRHHTFNLWLPQPTEEPMDIYIATRVVEYPDVYFCHAVWHELLILEAAQDLDKPLIERALEGESVASNETQAMA